ncbi:MAG: hypothetical protein ACI30S_03175 [Muribaculaceae bacterium]
MDTPKREIVVNIMLTGSYLQNNVGHEFVNYFQSDSGRNFVYLMAYGTFANAHKGKVCAVVNVRNVPGQKYFELVSIATGLREVYIPNNDAENAKIQQSIITTETYAGKTMAQIFQGCKQQDIYVTYEADKVLIPTQYTTIPYREEYGLSKGPNMSQKIYAEEGDSNFDILWDIIKEIEESGELQGKLLLDEIKRFKCEDGDICKNRMMDFSILETMYGRGDDEIAFSNAIAFLFLHIPKPLLKLFSPSGKAYNDEKVIDIYRELHNMDIVVKTTHRTIVIENKIHSGINSVKIKSKPQITNQLQKYAEQFDSLDDLKDFPRPVEFYILVPEYKRNINLNKYGVQGKYTVKTYTELFDAIKDIDADATRIPGFFSEIRRAIKRHTTEYPNDPRIDMMKKVAKIF